jgi:glycosyltransferase involved in cell wall biosynthesis
VPVIVVPRKSNAMEIDISVIIPAYNRFGMLTRVIDSILAQSVPVLEILVVDDGSKDETAEQMPQYIRDKPGWSERVRYFRQNNQGQSAAGNFGIAQAKGDWIAIAAHDDLWLPWKVGWQLRALDRYGVDCGLCFTDAWFMNNPHMKQTAFQFSGTDLDGPLGIIRDPVRMVVTRDLICTQTVLARKDLVLRAGGFDAYLRYSEDQDFLFRMALITRFCYVSMPMVLIDRSPADIRHSGESINWHKAEFCLRMDQYRFEKQLSLSESQPVGLRSIIKRNLRAIHSHWANWYLAHCQYKKARNAVRIAIGYELTTNLLWKWLLIRVAPRLTRMLCMARENSDAPRYDRTSWLTATSGRR